MGTSIQPKKCHLHVDHPLGPEYLENLQKRSCVDQRAAFDNDQPEFRMELTITIGIFQQLHLHSCRRSYVRNRGVGIKNADRKPPLNLN